MVCFKHQQFDQVLRKLVEFIMLLYVMFMLLRLRNKKTYIHVIATLFIFDTSIFLACITPPTISNATFDGNGSYIDGDEVFYKCNKKMRLIGSNKVVCKEGKWRYLGESPPRCEVGKKNKTKKKLCSMILLNMMSKKNYTQILFLMYISLKINLLTYV